MDSLDVGRRVHNIIDDRDMKQVELAELLDIPFSTLNGYMTGRNRFPLDVLCAVARELNVTTDYLLGMTPEPRPAFPLSKAEQKMVEDFRTLYKQQRELILQNIYLMKKQNQ